MNTLTHMNVHRRTLLTDKVLLPVEGTFDLSLDHWVRIDHVFITTDVTERLDRSAGPAAFIGHFAIKTQPFTLPEYEQTKQALHDKITAKIDEVIAAKQFSPITQVAQSHKL